MNEKIKENIGNWFSDRIVELNQNSFGITTASVEIYNNFHIHFLIDKDNNIIGFCNTYQQED